MKYSVQHKKYIIKQKILSLNICSLRFKTGLTLNVSCRKKGVLSAQIYFLRLLKTHVGGFVLI